jgi:2-aminobenzoate-CoA ligase
MTSSAHVDTFCADSLPPLEQWPVLLPLPYAEQLNCSVELLDRTIRVHGGDRPAVVGSDATWTYAELLDTVQRMSRVLIAWGVQPGNRVLLRSPNNAWLMASWLAVLRVGGVVVTTMPLLRRGELEKVVDIAKVQFALVDHRFLDEWNGFGVPTIVVGGESEDSLETRCASAEPWTGFVDTAADDISLLAFTSGTTGKPKATMHTHADVLAIADTFSRTIVKPTSDDVFAGSPPLAFTFGLGGLVIFPLRAGASTVLLEAASPAALLKAIAEYGVTCLFTAPTAYRAMLADMTAGGKVDLSSLRRCVSAGETLPEATWRAWFEATGIRLIDGIGATEMLHIFISAADDDIVPGATGRPVPGYEAVVVDDDFQPVDAGVPGRLAVRGPTGCRYLCDERQSVYVQQGWNVTGDIYTVDADGLFRYIARGDDMIVSSGYNIAAPEVEGALLLHDSVAEVAVVGEPDPDRGMVVSAYVVLRDPATAGDSLAVALQDHVKATIAPYKYPRRITFVNELPKTATGKLQRFRLKN